LVYFWVNWYIFSHLVHKPKKILATLFDSDQLELETLESASIRSVCANFATVSVFFRFLYTFHPTFFRLTQWTCGSIRDVIWPSKDLWKTKWHLTWICRTHPANASLL